MESGYKDFLKDNLTARVFVARTERLTAAWHYKFVRVSHWRLYANDRDGAFLDFAAGPLALRGGRVHLLPAGGTFQTRAEREVEHFYIHFEVVGLPNVALRKLFRGPILLPSAPALESIIAELRPRLLTDPEITLAQQWRVKAIVYEALAQYLQTVPAEQMELCLQTTRSMEPILPALRHIEDFIAEPLRNPALAVKCALNEDYFIRLFRQRMGQSPMHYIMERRVEMAAQRLLFTDQSIEQIAEETGFCNRSHFSRQFKLQKGVTPAQYRQNGVLEAQSKKPFSAFCPTAGKSRARVGRESDNKL